MEQVKTTLHVYKIKCNIEYKQLRKQIKERERQNTHKHN